MKKSVDAKKIKVLNLARFIAIKGLKPENDISLKIYYFLKERYEVQSLFVKPVAKIPFWAALLKKSLRKRRKLFRSNNYVDETYNIPVKFFEESFLLINKLPINSLSKIPFQFKFLKDELNREIHKFEPDLIHAHTTFPDGYYAYIICKDKNIPYIITLRGEYNKSYESNIYKKILKGAAQLHTPSVSLFNHLKESYSIELQPHPLESKWLDGNKSKQFKTLRLVTVSRLLEMKNIDLVLKAVQILHQSGYNISYTIIGEGDYRKELEIQTEELGLNDIVCFTGYKSHEEIKEYYSRTNIFVMLSRPETYGRVYFEAAAQGLVVIGSRNTGAHGHLSESEAIFIQENVDNLVKVLKNIPKEKLAEISENAQKAAERFAEDRIVSQYHETIKEAIDLSQ